MITAGLPVRSAALGIATLLLPVLQSGAQTPRVGPAHGAVLVVGGGALGPEVLERFIQLAGGPDALIVDVPTAGGDSVYPPDWRGTRSLTQAGAKHVVVLHTVDKKLADSDSFAAVLSRAGGVWFEGGRQWHLVDSYAGTKTEKAFHDVLARGGVVGGSSAGASILASYLLRGAREGNTVIMAPGYEQGFGFLRGVAIDQHVVARERLPDLADSLIPRHPELLGMSEDEGTAWLVRGDTAEIIGRNKAFAYGGRDPNDPGKPFVTLYPGDRYDLGARRVLHRAVDDSPVSYAFIDSLFMPLVRQGTTATVLVARNGEVLIDRSYGIPPQARYMPTTTVPNFPLGGLSQGFIATAAQLAASDGRLSLDDSISSGNTTTIREYLAAAPAWPDSGHQLVQLIAQRTGTAFPQLVGRRILTPIGAHKTVIAPDGQIQSNVDELYRWELGLESNRSFRADSALAADGGSDVRQSAMLGWQTDTFGGVARYAEYGTAAGKRNAFVRIPARRSTIIILTNSDAVDARALADRIADKLVK